MLPSANDGVLKPYHLFTFQSICVYVESWFFSINSCSLNRCQKLEKALSQKSAYTSKVLVVYFYRITILFDTDVPNEDYYSNILKILSYI